MEVGYWPYPKDPEATLDYKWDWKAMSNGSGPENWLGPSETITSFTVTLGSGLTLDSSVLADGSTSVIAWISGGTSGRTYQTHCRITTSEGRTDERTLNLIVEQR